MTAEPEPSTRGLQTTEGLRRLVAFTDAVVAIALTLLVLSLTDLASDSPEERTLGSFFDDHQDILIAFAVSFAVIWVLWRHHHQLIEYFRCYDSPLVFMHFLWLFTIVLMPFSTALIGTSMTRANTLYIGVLWVSVFLLGAMRYWGIHHPDLLEPGAPRRDLQVVGIDYSSIILLSVALLISAVWPETGQWPLLLLLLERPFGQIRARLRRKA
ncbi:TMEM175 family protein [Gordonia iterans]